MKNVFKKGQGLPLNVIVIAAIVILVLLVLSVIFLRSSSSFSGDVGSCVIQGGQCLNTCGENDNDRNPNDFTWSRPDLECPDGGNCCFEDPTRTESDSTQGSSSGTGWSGSNRIT